MLNPDLTPLSTEEIVKSIKTVYNNLSDRVLRENFLLFGLKEETPTILINFENSVPNKKNKFFNETHSFYLVKDYNQIIDILKELNIFREESESEIIKEYTKIISDSIYLTVTCFKPINFK